MWATPLGFIAVVAGWTTTEVGRQPWTVYGVMRTAQSVTPSLTGFDVLLSLAGYIAVYCIMFPAGLWFVLRIVRGGVAAEDSSRRWKRAAPPRPSSRCRRARACHDHLRFRADVDADPGPGGVLLCAAGRLRSGRGHSLQFRQDHGRPQSADEFHRADLGRQRDLAGAGRHRTAGGFSAGLRHHPAGRLFPHPGDAAGADLPRRGV